jgi:homocitrate synthase NifV
MIKIVDTTLRDGEQRAGIALGIKEKIQVAKLLDDLNIYQIEAGIPIMGGNEKKSVDEIGKLGLKAKVSAWNRMNLKDIEESTKCNVDIIHISIPSSEIQIRKKMKKSYHWVLNNMKKCIQYAKKRNFEVTLGLEDASRAEMEFIFEVIELGTSLGVKRYRYADTVGILHRHKIIEDFKEIFDIFDVDIEIHAHNDLGMAVSNSITAVKSGVKFVDTTIGGIGERVGNCDFLKFAKVLKDFDIECNLPNYNLLFKKQEEIINVIKG